jgi:ribosomal protein S6--L-glutamate ligase
MTTEDKHSLSIAVLTTRSKSYSVKRILEVGRSRGHRMRAYDPAHFAILLDQDEPTLTYRGKPVGGIDAVIPRVSAHASPFGVAVVRHFEQMGIFCANSSQSMLASRDKFRATQTMTRKGIGLPRTAFVAETGGVAGALDYVGGAPVVVKLIEGTQGVGVTLAEHRQTAMALVDMLHSANQNVLMQAFVAESRGKDIRAFVVDGKVVAAMRRTALGDEFRSNLHRGGSAEPVELDEQYKGAAVRAAQVLGLRIAGVDILESDRGPLVIEVNSSPGLEGIEGATDVDVAGAIVEFVESECHLPEIDLRQRLAMAHGHGIVELKVAPESALSGRSIADSPLGNEAVRVLTVSHGASITPLPRAAHVMQTGDVLVVFGPSALLRDLAPKLGRRRKPRARKSVAELSTP